MSSGRQNHAPRTAASTNRQEAAAAMICGPPAPPGTFALRCGTRSHAPAAATWPAGGWVNMQVSAICTGGPAWVPSSCGTTARHGVTTNAAPPQPPPQQSHRIDEPCLSPPPIRHMRTWPRCGLACPRPPASRCANWRLKLSTAGAGQAAGRGVRGENRLLRVLLGAPNMQPSAVKAAQSQQRSKHCPARWVACPNAQAHPPRGRQSWAAGGRPQGSRPASARRNKGKVQRCLSARVLWRSAVRWRGPCRSAASAPLPPAASLPPRPLKRQPCRWAKQAGRWREAGRHLRVVLQDLAVDQLPHLRPRRRRSNRSRLKHSRFRAQHPLPGTAHAHRRISTPAPVPAATPPHRHHPSIHPSKAVTAVPSARDHPAPAATLGSPGPDQAQAQQAAARATAPPTSSTTSLRRSNSKASLETGCAEGSRLGCDSPAKYGSASASSAGEEHGRRSRGVGKPRCERAWVNMG